MRHDVLADVFSAIKNMEGVGKRKAMVPSSVLVGGVLKLMQKHQYIGKVTLKNTMFTVEITGKINDCNVIRPRFSVKTGDFIKWEKRYLPANHVGMLILSTTKGILDHRTAKEDGIGGQLLGFVY